MTNTTVEIVVPDNVIGSVYGEGGSNLSRLRQVINTLSFEIYSSSTAMLALFPPIISSICERYDLSLMMTAHVY